MKSGQEIILLGMFDLDKLDRAMPVRIHNLFNSLQTLTPVRLIAGGRIKRRAAILRFLMNGGFRNTRAIYVEASTSTATELDLVFLALARLSAIPILVFIPDAYQFFPHIFPRTGWKVKLLDLGWRISIAAYQRLASRLLYPSYGLAACFQNQADVDVLPPGGLPDRWRAPLAWDPPAIVYLGAASHRYGSDMLLDAMEKVVSRFPSACCRFITVDDRYLQSHPARRASWLSVERKHFEDLPEVMRSATLTVAPLLRNSYNDLAMPVKIFDYMSFGRPLVVTDCRDMAALVNEFEAGVVVQDNVESLAGGILRLLEDPKLASRLGKNAYQAIQTAHSWEHRAARLLEMVAACEAGPQPERNVR